MIQKLNKKLRVLKCAAIMAALTLIYYWTLTIAVNYAVVLLFSSVWGILMISCIHTTIDDIKHYNLIERKRKNEKIYNS